MPIITPNSITEVAWQGDLEQTISTMGGGDVAAKVTIGRPVWWDADKYEQETGKKWAQPADNRAYRLIRLACTLHPVENGHYTFAELTTYLRPKTGSGTVVAHDLFPKEKRGEEKHKIGAGLGPGLKIGEIVDLTVGGITAEIEHTNVYPVILAYGLSESKAYWRFKEHATALLEGSQFVYLMAAADAGIEQMRLTVELKANVKPRRFSSLFHGGTPDSANIGITIPLGA